MKRVALTIYNKLASPILTKELRGTFRRWLFFTVFTTTLGIAAIVVLIVVFANYARGIGQVSADDIGRSIFIGLVATQSVLLVLLLPGFCSTFISGERSAQSYDMLIATRLKSWEIIWGKLLASGAYIATFLLATLPLAALSFLYGGVTPWEIIGAYLTLLAIGMLIAVISISISGLFQSVVWSVIVSYLVMFGIMVVCPIFSGFFLISSAVHRTFSAAGPGFYVDPMLQVVQWVIYAAVFILFFITAVNRVKPFSANRSTALRIYSTSVVAVLLGFLLTFALLNAHSWAGKVGDFVFTVTESALLGTGFLFITLYLVLYPVEHNRQSVRVLRKMFRRPAILRPFFPGGRTGMQFTIASVIFWLGAITAVGTAIGGTYMDSEQLTKVIVTAAYITFFLVSYALVGFWLSTTKLPQWGARVMLLVILLCNVLVPWLAATIITTGTAGYSHSDYWKTPLHYISPIGAGHAIAVIKDMNWIAVSFAFHLMVIFVFGVIAFDRSRRVRREQLDAVRSTPLRRPEAEMATAEAR